NYNNAEQLTGREGRSEGLAWVESSNGLMTYNNNKNSHMILESVSINNGVN
ncbi:hypothetical protein ACJX0J_006141, partial [Zea mays]